MKSSTRMTADSKAMAPPPAIGENGKPLPSNLNERVLGFLVNGHTVGHIVEFLIDGAEGPRLSLADAQAVVRAVVLEVSGGEGLDSKAYKKGLAEAAYLSLYQKMVTCGDFNGARGAIDKFVELNKLKEVTPPRQPKEIPTMPPVGNVKLFAL